MGKRALHTIQHPAGIVEAGNTQHGFSTLAIPRLSSKLLKSIEFSNALELMHYTGPKRVLPPTVVTSHTIGISYREVCSRQASLLAAQEKDAQWLNNLSDGHDSMEWNGYNNQLARTNGIPKLHVWPFG